VSSSTPRRLPGESLYRTLLLLYPQEFRARYGEDMAEFYRDRVRLRAGSRSAVARLWLRLIPDVLGGAVAEHP